MTSKLPARLVVETEVILSATAGGGEADIMKIQQP